MLVFEGPGLGSHWWVETHQDLPPAQIQSLAADIESRISTFQSDYSRFLDESYIGQLNTKGQLKSPPPELVEIISAAEQLREQTHGRFNVGVGAVLESLGYDAQYHLTEQGETSKVGMSVIEESSEAIIRIQPGARIDLGGIGKGWLIDALAGQLDRAGLSNYFVNGGGDIVVNSPGQPFTFALENPFDPKQGIGEITIEQGGIGGSSANRRQWKSATSGKTHHHIVDPSTGASHPGPAAIFTYGETATAADVAATILFLTPPQEISEMAKTLKVEYLVVEQAGTFSKSENYPGKLFA